MVMQSWRLSAPRQLVLFSLCQWCLWACDGRLGFDHRGGADGRDGRRDGEKAASAGDGDVGDGDGDDRPDPEDMPAPGRDGSGQARDLSFRCDPDQSRDNLRFRRLTAGQYDNSLRDLFAAALADSTRADALMSELAPVVSALPADERFRSAEDLHGSYRRLDQAVGQAHVEAWYQVAVAAGAALSRSDYLTRMAGPCASDRAPDNDDACLDDFVARVGRLAFRRPLDQEELALYRSFYGESAGEDPAGYGDVLSGLLNAPQFLYLIEHGDQERDPLADDGALPSETLSLSAHELAARLSYHFWDAPPDARLAELADSGELLERAVFEGEVERLFDDPRTRASVREFYRDWLKLEDLPPLDANNDFPRFRAFAGGDLPSDTLRGDMIEEVLDMLDHHTWTAPAALSQLLLSDRAFPRSDELARLYGLPRWDGQAAPPSFNPDERPGLLTRAAFLATGSATTRPIMKGVFIRRNILCDAIPPPPDNAAANAPEVTADQSTRELVEEITEQEGSVCANCHKVAINPLGFASEGFDALGRARTEQVLIADSGEVVGMAALDTRSVPRVFSDDETVSEGPADLMRLIADSGKAEACLARHYFRFSFGRFEDEQRDGCVLEQLRIAASQGGSLSELLKAVALSPAFRTRSFSEPSGANP